MSTRLPTRLLLGALGALLATAVVVTAAAAAGARSSSLSSFVESHAVVVPTAIAVLGAMTFLAYWLPRRKQPRPFVFVAGAVAVLVTFSLALPTYWLCHDGEAAFWTPLWNSLDLFTGSLPLRSGDAQRCTPVVPVALQVARLSALFTTVLGLAAVLRTLFAAQVDRLRVRLARRLVVVMGLSPDAFPLLRAIVVEHRGHVVVLLEPELSQSLVVEARRLGVCVIDADPDRGSTLAAVFRRAAISVVYLLRTDADINIGRALKISQRPSAPALGSAPVRMIVRIDDFWRAEEWRRSQIGRTGPYLVDTVGFQQVTAQELIDRALSSAADRLILLGSGLLALAVLDELAQHRREQQVIGRSVTAKVQVLDPGCALVIGDHQTRQAWFGNEALPAIDGLPEEATVETLRRAAHGAKQPWVIDTREPTSSRSLENQRTASRLPELMILTPAASTEGVAARPMLSNLLAYGPTLTTAPRPGRLSPQRGVPEDAWTRLARRQHEKHLQGRTRTDLATVPWDDLDDFYRYSNVRSIKVVLGFTAAMGRTWVAPTRQGAAAVPALLTDEEIRTLARIEHEDWLAYYRAHRWRLGPRDLEARRNESMLPWEKLSDDDRDRTEEQLRSALVALAALGYRPFAWDDDVAKRPRARRFDRVGQVSARQRRKPWTWRNRAGGVMEARADDWEVSDGVDVWSVGPEEFDSTYRQLDGGVWVRTGSVTAVEAGSTELRETREGTVSAEPQDWLLQDDSGAQWVVPSDKFGSGYQEQEGRDG